MVWSPKKRLVSLELLDYGCPCQWSVQQQNAWNGAGGDTIHAYVRIIFELTSTSNNDSYKNKQRTYINWDPKYLKGHMLHGALSEGLFTIRERQNIFILPSRIIIQCTRRCGATTWTMYTVIYPIWNILRLLEVQKGTRGKTMNWYRNIRFNPLAMRVLEDVWQ